MGWKSLTLPWLFSGLFVQLWCSFKLSECCCWRSFCHCCWSPFRILLWGLFWNQGSGVGPPISSADLGLSCFSALLWALSLRGKGSSAAWGAAVALGAMGAASQRKLAVIVEEAEPGEGGLCLFWQRLLKRAQLTHFKLASMQGQPVYISCLSQFPYLSYWILASMVSIWLSHRCIRYCCRLKSLTSSVVVELVLRWACAFKIMRVNMTLLTSTTHALYRNLFVSSIFGRQ